MTDMNRDEMPIMVTGPGRCGSTWVQFLLCHHPRIHVHGQSPRFPWCEYWGWYQRLLRAGRWSQENNRMIGYPIPHYAGSPPDRAREVFKRTFRDFVCGYAPGKPRWGMKWLGFPQRHGEASQFEALWPETRWVVCLRDPFKMIDSLKNTFAHDASPRQQAEAWVETCRFVEQGPAERVVLIQIDHLNGHTGDQRREALENVFRCIGEEPTPETEAFLCRWPVIHKVRPDAERSFALSQEAKQRLLEDVADLARYAKQLGYGVSNP